MLQLVSPFVPTYIRVFSLEDGQHYVALRDFYEALGVSPSMNPVLCAKVSAKLKVKVGYKNTNGISFGTCCGLINSWTKFTEEEKETAKKQFDMNRCTQEPSYEDEEEKEEEKPESSASSLVPKKRERSTKALLEMELGPVFDSFRSEMLGSFSQVIENLRDKAEDAQKRAKIFQDQNEQLKAELENERAKRADAEEAVKSKFGVQALSLLKKL